jgi:DNA repair exonuclease SbcCD ATPase subunit
MNVMKSYETILNEIQAAEDALLNAHRQWQEAKQSLAEVEPDLEGTKRSLRKALLSANKEEITRLEKVKAETERKRQGDRLRVERLGEEVKKIETRLKGLQTRKNELFGELLRAWLQSETKKYDLAAKEAMMRKERLVVAHALARQRGLSIVSSSEIGPGLAYLSKVGIPVLAEFDATLANADVKFSVTSRQIEKEILEGGGST